MHVNTYPRLHLITYNNMCTIAPVHLVLLDPRHMTGQLRLSSSPSDAARTAVHRERRVTATRHMPVTEHYCALRRNNF